MAPNMREDFNLSTESAQDVPLNDDGGGGGTDRDGGSNPSAPGADYYAGGVTEAATESALMLAKIRHRIRLTKRDERLVIVLVGLPGRGKSFIARKLRNFVTWRGSECRVFNVGKYRRRTADGACGADFFDAQNERAAEMRQRAASLALDDMLRWLDGEELDAASVPGAASSPDAASSPGADSVPGDKAVAGRLRKDRVGIFDATNSTRERREWVLRECTSGVRRAGKPTGVVFVESICDDRDLLHANFLTKVNNSPDYGGMDAREAMSDLLSRVRKYEEAYETIEDDTQSYIKVFNLSSKVLVNHIYGRMAKSIVPALMAWNIGTRPVFVCRAGTTMDGDQRIGLNRGMSRGESLGRRGRAFRDALLHHMGAECLDFMRRRQQAAFSPGLNAGTSVSGRMGRGFGSHGDLASLTSAPVGASRDDDDDDQEDEYLGTDGTTPLPFPCHIMTSTMPRARQTVKWEGMPYPVEMMSNLNPLDKGDYTGQELEDLAVEHPDWYDRLVADPFYTRFPGGECYGDLTSRLESVVVDIEQQVGPVLVVSHVSVLQVLVAYFRNTPVEDCTSIALPMNTVLKFTPAKGGGWQESQHCLINCPGDSRCDSSGADDGARSRAPSGEGHGTPPSRTPTGTPTTRTPIVSQVHVSDHRGGRESTPDLVSPLATPPIWGDHSRGNVPYVPSMPSANIL